MPQEHVSLNDARRIALAAQGFDRSRPSGRVDVRHLRRTIHQLGLLQIDYVNVLVPAHYQVPFSRLGPYQRTRLDDLIYLRREFTEQWAHEASILPMASWPLFRHRMAVHRARPWGFDAFMRTQHRYAESVLDEIRARGPLSAADLPEPPGAQRQLSRDGWSRSVPRAVLEAHFGRGALAVTERLRNFARMYDLSERAIPPEYLQRQVEPDIARRTLVLMAARSHGIGTAADLADYYRMPSIDTRSALADLVSAGELREARVEGWKEVAYLHPEATSPRRIDAAALLSPFDPVVWFRPRAARLFEFDYRIEIFVSAPKRRWGYYVLPFLMGDRIVARVDLKADRAGGRLLALAAYLEPGAPPATVAFALAVELRTMADWLGLDEVGVRGRSDFNRRLAVAVRST